MTQQLTDYQAADTSVLASAVFLTEKINSADGHAEAVETIIPIYLAKNDVDTAAQLADSVENSFVRDRLLVQIAEKCAENDDDEYALQLADAIEDKVFQEEAREAIAIQKAGKAQIEKAFELAETVEHNSHSFGAIALKLQEKGDEVGALQTIERIEDATAKVGYLESIALEINKKEQAEKATTFLQSAREEAENIEVEEERVRALQSIASTYEEIGRKDKTIEVLGEARNLAELLEGAHRNSLLSQISVSFLQAGSLDLADRTLDLVDDKVIVAATLTHYAKDYYERGEHAEALEILEEARAILISQHEREVRNSRDKFSVLASIASQFALVEKPERALAVALENPLESERFSSLIEIAQICASKDRDDLANQAIKEITEDSKRTEGLIAASNAKQQNGKTAEALNLLNEAYRQTEDVGQVTSRIDLLNKLALRFHKAGDIETARKIAKSNIGNISGIFDESLKAIALANLGAVYEKLGFNLDQEEKDSLLALLRQPPRF